MRAFLLAAALAAASAANPCASTIPGAWVCSSCASGGNQTVRWNTTDPTDHTYIAIPITNTGWAWGKGLFSSDYSTVSALYSSGHVETGTVDPTCTSISWSDKSKWSYTGPLPPMPQIKVHLVPHSHDGERREGRTEGGDGGGGGRSTVVPTHSLCLCVLPLPALARGSTMVPNNSLTLLSLCASPCPCPRAQMSGGTRASTSTASEPVPSRAAT
jgi:hypothetical protein